MYCLREDLISKPMYATYLPMCLQEVYQFSYHYFILLCLGTYLYTTRKSAQVQKEQLLSYITSDIFVIYRFLFKPLGNV